MLEIDWTSQEAETVARAMFTRIKLLANPTRKDMESAFKVAQTVLPQNRRKRTAYKMEFGPVRDRLEELLESSKEGLDNTFASLQIGELPLPDFPPDPPDTIVQDDHLRGDLLAGQETPKGESEQAIVLEPVPEPISPPPPAAEPVTTPDTAADLLAFYDLLNDRVTTVERSILGMLDGLRSTLERIESKLGNTPAPATAKTGKIKVAVFNLLDKQHGDLLKKAAHLPIEITFFHADKIHSFPKTKVFQFVIYGRFGNHTGFNKIKQIYGNDQTTYVSGGHSAIIEAIENHLIRAGIKIR